MELSEIYRQVDAILNKVAFEQIAPGFHRYRFALYDDKSVCLDGELMPYDEQFMGNTSLLYDGEYIAIWNVGFDPVEDREQLAASVVHEMFHCHQNTLGEKRFPSDLKLLDYPNDVENLTRKYNENCALADAYENGDADALARFAAIRSGRMAKYPGMVREELKVETLEGAAEYAGMKALRMIAPEKFERKVQDYLRRLREESEQQFDIRRISYFVGAVYFLCMERLGYAVRNEIGSELTAYEQNPIAPAAQVEIRPCLFIETAYAKLVEERQRTIDEHITAFAYTECESMICGYDPMNMFRVGNRIYCKYFVFLKVGGEVQHFRRAIVLELKDCSQRDVKGYY
ncbi:MAG: hypothetical protein IKM11_07410 [Oscillospiraceae bacterium]|nr:hypothetical protein [Oscillospiraceae bacterium]